MKHTLILASILLLFAACRHDSQPQNQQIGGTLQLVKSFPLSRISTLQLYRSADTDNYITLQLVDDDGKISEIMGMGNADFDSDSIVLHPLLLADSSLMSMATAIPKSSAIPTPATPTAPSSPSMTESSPPSRIPNKTIPPR